MKLTCEFCNKEFCSSKRYHHCSRYCYCQNRRQKYTRKCEKCKILIYNRKQKKHYYCKKCKAIAIAKKKKIELTCKICSKVFLVYPRRRKAKTCSNKCRGKLKSKVARKWKKCKGCRIIILVKRYCKYKRQFCSKQCWGEFKTKKYKRHCKFCKKVFYVPNYRKRARFCTKDCSDKSKVCLIEIKVKCYTCKKSILRSTNSCRAKTKKTKNYYCNNICYVNRGRFSLAKRIEKRCEICNKKLMIRECIVKFKDRKKVKTYHCSRKCLFSYQHQLRNKGPNKSERKVIKMLRGTGFHFVGHFKFEIGGKFPDFVSRRRKKVIEFFGEHWHQKSDEHKRKNHFAKYGYQCLIIWGRELKRHPETTRRKLLQFAK